MRQSKPGLAYRRNLVLCFGLDGTVGSLATPGPRVTVVAKVTGTSVVGAGEIRASG